MTTRRHFLAASAAALATPALMRDARADTYPSRQIRAMIPFSAGSTIDVVGRIVLDPLARELGQTIVVENRGGAGGTIGSALVAKAEPDGYYLLVNGAAHSATPAAYPNAPFDPAKDFASVIPFGSVPNVLLVAPTKGIKTVKDFVDAAKAGTFSFSSAGIGSTTHWAAERLRFSAGFKAVHVPFRGGPEALTEVMTGRVDFCCMGMGSALPFISDKQLVPLAVSTPQRSRALPDIPTTLEAGLADSDYNFWTGLFVPAGTPKEVIERLHRDTQKVLAQPGVQEKFAPQGIEPMPMSPADFDALIRKEIVSNIAFVKAAGLKFN
jgi:tripartite-type tricarboxylate transporter receptor subunit TctC